MALINVGSDPWLLEYEACERLSREIAEQLGHRDREKVGSQQRNAISAKIRIRLKQLKAEVMQLHDKQKSASVFSSLTNDERERRSRQIEQLQCRYMQLEEQFSRPSGIGTSQNIVVDIKTTGWGNGDDDDELLDQPSSSLSVPELRQNQTQMIRDQDKGLENLSSIIARQKQIAGAIGTEVDDQNEILDDIATGMDRVNTQVNSETSMIRSIGRKDNTCWYWVIIILLLVVILSVALA